MAASRKKKPAARKKAPARRSSAKKKAPQKRSAPRVLPNDAAWRELVETAVEKPEPPSAGRSASTRSAAGKKAARK